MLSVTGTSALDRSDDQAQATSPLLEMKSPGPLGDKNAPSFWELATDQLFGMSVISIHLRPLPAQRPSPVHLGLLYHPEHS